MKWIYSLITVLFLIGCGSGSSDSKNTLTETSQQGVTTVNTDELNKTLSTLQASSLSMQESEDLLVLREEEKLAHDVYRTLFDAHSMAIFNNIADAEQTHTDAVLSLIERYGLEDPVGDNTRGVFENETLQNLYDTLVMQGEQSLLDALIVGATVEDLDIWDIEEMMMRTDKSDLMLVYENLQKGSRNHLRSFVKQIESQGGTYVPIYISQEMYESIVNSEMERGE
jgi:hypothetical protein